MRFQGYNTGFDKEKKRREKTMKMTPLAHESTAATIPIDAYTATARRPQN
jgi:ribosomal protein S12